MLRGVNDVMLPPEHFADWACDSRRGVEERYGALQLIEATRPLWNHKHNVHEAVDYRLMQERYRKRQLDPAYEPRFTREQALRAQEILPDFKILHATHFDDRPLRDISFLRFCPALESVSTHNSEISDWSPLLSLPALVKLNVGDKLGRDFTVLGNLTGLEHLQLWLWKPWPDLTGMDRLARLKEFHFHGNILVLESIPRLPAVRRARITQNHAFRVPVRMVANLPDMPELRQLHLERTTSLDGIERYSELLNLTVHGDFTDFGPLASLQKLTHLETGGADYPGLTPVSRMASLRKITLHLEIPPDLTPLADLPLLHEIAIENSPIVPPELESLNSLCIPWDIEFSCSPARRRGPLRLLIHQQDEPDEGEDTTADPRNWGDDIEMSKSEARWFTRKVNTLLDRLLGKGWGHGNDRHAHSPGYHHITITRPEDIDRLPGILRVLRKAILEARHPWRILLIVDSLARYERDMDEIALLDDEEFDAEREREEWEYSRKLRREHREYIERKYRLLLSKETGIPIPPPSAKDPPPAGQSGNIAEAEESEDDDPDEPEYDLGTRLHLYATLTEKAVYINERDRELAEMLFELKAGE